MLVVCLWACVRARALHVFAVGVVSSLSFMKGRGGGRERVGGGERETEERERESTTSPLTVCKHFSTLFFSRKSLSALYLYLRSRSSIAKKGSFRAPRRSALFVAVFFFWPSFVTCLSAPNTAHQHCLSTYLPIYLPTYLSIYISLYVTTEVLRV